MNDRDLSTLERELIEHAAAGTTCDVSGRPDDDRRVCAAVIYELCVGARWTVHAKGVRLTGARIEEPLDFEHATLRAPLKLRDCDLRGAVTFTSASVPALDLAGSKLTQPLLLERTKITDELRLAGAKLTGVDGDGYALLANAMHVAGDAFLRKGFEAAGAISLLGASIDGQLSMSGAKLTGADSDGYALLANAMHVGDEAFLRKGFEAAGAISLLDASIGGPLNMAGAKLTGTDSDGYALIADRLHVGAGASLREGFEAAGAISLGGASIDGPLSMAGAKLTGTDSDGNALDAYGLHVGAHAHLSEGFEAAGAIRLLGASIGGQLVMAGAKLTSADDDGYAMNADGMHVGADAFLSEGFEAAGAIRLLGARIGGQLVMAGAKLTGADDDGYALFAYGMHVGADAHLREGFEAAGAISLMGASIGGLDMAGAKLTGTDSGGYALVADGMHVISAAILRERFEAAGAIRLLGANISRQLDMSGAKLAGTDSRGYALAADRLHVGTDAFLSDGFEPAGAIGLLGANIGGQLNMTGAKLTGTDGDGNALVAYGMHVGSSAFLREGFKAAGALRLGGANIDGQLVMSGAKLSGTDSGGDALAAHGIHVGSDALLSDGFEAAGAIRLLGASIGGQLSFVLARAMPRLQLQNARCGQLADNEASWPPSPGSLVLRGFRFGALVIDTQWHQRLEWVRRQGFVDWSPDPYEQLASYYTSTGDEAAARRVRIAKHDDELTHLKTTRKKGSRAYRFWRRPFGWLVGYGYRRHRAGWLLALTLVTAGLMFRWAEAEGAIVPNEPHDSAGRPEPCGEAYPCFNSLVYGADVVLPIIDFGQDGAWRPIESSGPGPLWIWARWAFIAFGWALASVFVAAFTGLVQRG
jgi:hypothetical protein